MTWVIAAGTFLGYGYIISDTCITFEDSNGTEYRKDCLQKIYPIAPSIIAGFAGSVKIGFDLLEDLYKFLYIPPEQQGNGSWIPQWVAGNWQERAKEIFGTSSDDLKEGGSEILMVSVDPNEDHGSPRFPKIYVINMRAPDYEPIVLSDYSKIFSIGSGSDVNIYRQKLKDLLEDDGYSPLMQSEVGNIGGFAEGIAFQLFQAINENPVRGISKYLHIGIVTNRLFKIIPFNLTEINGAEITEHKMPQVASNWDELKQILSVCSSSPYTATAIK